MEYAVQIRHLSHTYGTLPVLDDISLAIRAGEFVSVVGPSGCGKSTLLKILGGLLPPQSGGGEVCGARSMVFQYGALLPWRTAAGNARLPLELAGVRGADAGRKTDEMLALVGLRGFERFYPRELSGGMQQRVALARALIGSPQLLLMDEPFGALDELAREQMQAVLLQTRSQLRRQNVASPAVLFVTHSVQEAVYLSDRVVVLSPRPARIEAVVDITLPRPRRHKDGVQFSPEFNALAAQVRGHLKV